MTSSVNFGQLSWLNKESILNRYESESVELRWLVWSCDFDFRSFLYIVNMTLECLSESCKLSIAFLVLPSVNTRNGFLELLWLFSIIVRTILICTFSNLLPFIFAHSAILRSNWCFKKSYALFYVYLFDSSSIINVDLVSISVLQRRLVILG